MRLVCAGLAIFLPNRLLLKGKRTEEKGASSDCLREPFGCRKLGCVMHENVPRRTTGTKRKKERELRGSEQGMKKTYRQAQAEYDAKHVEIRDKFMSYDGPNAELVREVFQFAFSDVPFSARGSEEQDPELLIINDMRRADDAANGVGKEGLFQLQPEICKKLLNRETLVEGQDDLFTWFDLLENMVAECIWTSHWHEWVKDHEQSWKVFQQLDTRYLIRHLSRLLPEGAPGPDGDSNYYRDKIADNATATLIYEAQNRAYNGSTSNFWEQLFGLYKRGLWPCGWQGVWPSRGRFITWRRES